MIEPIRLLTASTNVWFKAPSEPDLTSTFVDVTIEKTYKDGVSGHTAADAESSCITGGAADAPPAK